ncbi:phosphatidylinositol N-acetylglucosaminyltransferase subunit C isoform X2 [Microplitis demolitor]|nr:phosphatidylinositol N-acetylglucosaminyltransferase subunit C isoform X2 [Microplitis demolitor]XP_014299338.1 phosphatidylinositol N-acetylglucosaminyltransferase subunit C isoform X2 [Microplitis demolitor]XP_014299339.1 phosphatidylinositol N-acetylglucosaminyltransferase subunit C isoform X2 [Microplitis demolitor]
MSYHYNFRLTTKPWRKNLYENHGLPDNYTDSSFLHDLRKNIKPNNVTINEALTLGASISIQLSIVILFVMVFIWLKSEWATPNNIFIYSTLLTLIGYLIYIKKFPNNIARVSKDSRTALIFLVFGYILSPVLKTLTETVSTDTIYAMTIFMFFIHLVFSKYGSPPVSLSDSLSITSSIFGSLMLASRLISPLHAFSLLTVAVQCFVLLPFLLSIKQNNNIIISLVLTLVALYYLITVSTILSLVFIIATIFISVICPLWYVRWQKYKENIYGPWDEAVITKQ